MKNIIILLLLFLPFLVLAQNGDEPKRSRGFRVLPGTTEELRMSIDARRKSSESQRAGMEGDRLEVDKNQARLRDGAQILMIMEKMVGERGEELSELASDLSLSSERTINIEEEFRGRSGIMKFFFGNKKELRIEMDEILEKRQEKVDKISSIIENYSGDNEVKDILAEQMSNIIEENKRLKEYSEKETKRRGLFGWIGSFFD